MEKIKKKILKELLAKDSVEKVLSYLLDYASNSDLEEELIIISSHFHNNEKDYNSGLINSENYKVRRTSIIKYLLSFIRTSYSKNRKNNLPENTQKYYEKIFYNWIKAEFTRAKEIKLNYEIYPRIIIDCYLETQDEYKFIFITNKGIIEKIEEFLTNLLKVTHANSIFVVSFNNDKDVYFNYLQIDDFVGDIMDIYSLENLSLLEVEINKKGKISKLSDSIYQLSEEDDEDD